MPEDAKYQNLELLESVIIPMGNLRFTLEDILRNGRSINTQDLLRGLQVVHRNAAAIHEHLAATRATDISEQPERMTLRVLQELDAQIADTTEQLEFASKDGNKQESHR